MTSCAAGIASTVRAASTGTLRLTRASATGPSSWWRALEPTKPTSRPSRETGEPAGGLWGKTAYNWCFVELFVIPAQCRGQDLGSKVLAQAEDIARTRGCTGLWLDTYWFQAPEFYQKQGYEVVGTLPDYPRGGPRYFLKKSLV